MAQTVSRRHLTAEARFRARVSHVEFAADKVRVGQVFLEALEFPLSVSSLHTHVHWG
jgi:hypothetical protein